MLICVYVLFLKVEEANEQYKVCVTNVEERRNDLENTKREILAQLRKLVFQCDLTLKAVSNFFSTLKARGKKSTCLQKGEGCLISHDFYEIQFLRLMEHLEFEN